jgi:hypothetical protein
LFETFETFEQNKKRDRIKPVTWSELNGAMGKHVQIRTKKERFTETNIPLIIHINHSIKEVA